MEIINQITNYFKEISQEQVLNIVLAVIIIMVSSLLSSILAYGIIKIFRCKEKDKTKIKENAFFKPLKFAIIVIGVYGGILLINLPKEAMDWVNKILEIITIGIVAKGLANIFAPHSLLMKKIEKSNRVSGNETLANFISKTTKGIIYVVAGVLIISALGYNLNGLIAGLGVGSVVIALAAQDLAKSILSGAMILLDKPFEIGDWVQDGTYEGTVVDITFRSTRIKTVEDTIVTIPNSKLIENPIINFAKMEKRRYSFNIKLPLQTNSDTVETMINRIKFTLANNKDVIKESIIVECNSILEDGINILVAMNTSIVDYNSYLSFRTNVNEIILNIIESEGIRLSNPTQDIYVVKE